MAHSACMPPSVLVHPWMQERKQGRIVLQPGGCITPTAPHTVIKPCARHAHKALHTSVSLHMQQATFHLSGLLPQVGVCFCTPWRGGAEQTVCSQSAPDSQETRDRRWLCPPACHSKHTREIKSRISGKKRGVAGVEPASRSSVHMEEGSRVGKATHLPSPRWRRQRLHTTRANPCPSQPPSP